MQNEPIPPVTRDLADAGPVPRPGRWVYICAVFVAGMLVAAGAIRSMAAEPLRPAWLALVAVSWGCAPLALRVPGMPAMLSIVESLAFVLALAFGAGPAILASVGDAFFLEFRLPKPRLDRVMFNLSEPVLPMAACSLVLDLYSGLSPAERTSAPLSQLVLPAFAAALAYQACNMVLTSAAMAICDGGRFLSMMRKSVTWAATTLGWMALALVLVHGVGDSGALGALAVLPLAAIVYAAWWTAVRRSEDARRHADVQLATIEALTLAIEAKDATTRRDVERFEVYASGLARKMGMEDADIAAVTTAALLHDIGNLGVPEHILSKPGPLTPEEFGKVRVHPTIGADIIGSVPFPRPVAPIIASHHERWDGSGYPAGLAGDAIPLGARILSVVDTFTSLIVDRPYQPARSSEDAVSVLLQQAGTRLDPAAVRAFIEILPALEQRVRREEIQGATTAGGRSAPSRNPLDDIAGARREAQALSSLGTLDSSMGLADALSRLTEALPALLPNSAWAVFLADGKEHVLVCCHACGLDETAPVRRQPQKLEDLLAGRVTVTGGESVPEGQFGSRLAAPLMVGPDTIGALVLFHLDARAYDADHRRVLGLLAQRVAPVINSALQFERAREASLTDPLTGLANRRALHEQLPPELARSGRLHAPTAVLLLDLDGLKRINDVFGHHAGDCAIRATAAALRGLLRHHDLCVRYAGDEFVLVLRDCSREAALERAGALQAAVAGTRVEVRPGVTTPLSISAGVAVFPDDGTSQDALIACADQRMYENKQERKQRELRSFSVGR